MAEDKQNSFGNRLINGAKSFLGSTAGGAIINGAIGFGQSLFNNHLAEKSAESQYQRQLDFWHKQNAYNSPSAQRQRFQAAGINPNSVTGEMASSGASQGLSSVPGNEYAQSGVLKLEGLAQTLEIMSRIEKLGAETGLITSQMTSEALRQTLIGFGIKEAEVDYIIRDYERQAKELEVGNLPYFYEHSRKMYALEESYKSAQIEYENAQTQLANAKTEESKESAKKLVAETGLIALKQETEKEIAELTEQQRFESKSRTYINRQEISYRQITDGLRARSLRLANKISASESTIKEIEAVFSNIDASMYTNSDGTPNWAKYTSEVIGQISKILSVFVPVK